MARHRSKSCRNQSKTNDFSNGAPMRLLFELDLVPGMER